ncbi:pimeloyl-ACP methyl ester carboxylesterase [Streptosporangium album]|uniref:Pimeloyl-ACP methyl ester carboxylesterase n=1 Tax=Streptosporangium album TaxID=47479 RepID=A0A7W7S1S8_9ACTN|nr:alpha/beta fold hydrolase [Streptosporangium album]MBB4942348.1 pimeloyl-ACP methyl ester carboxylesterase [Streptosporangium album]
MIIKALGLALAAALLPGAPTPPAGPHQCANASARCDGSIDVPLAWENASSERLSVAFAWIPAKGADGTVVANLGGPLPALPTVPEIQRILGPVLERKNLLVMDPRGFGKSTPPLCPGTGLDKPETIAACAKSVGPKGAYFTADQASHDLDALRRALGLGKVSFFGNSYGTLYAQAYAARYPGSLDAVFLDSSMVMDRDGYARWPSQVQLDHLDLVCGRSKACGALPGSASGTWARLVDRLRERPDPEVSVFQTSALSGVSEPVFGRESTAAADAYLRGDPAPLRRLARLIPKALPPDNDPHVAGYLGYRCGDGTFPFDRLAPAAEREAQAVRYYERVRPLAPYQITDIFPGIGSVEPCINWPTPRHSPPRPPGQALPAVPVLVMAGDFDINSPADVARSVRAFPNATVVRVPFGRHALSFPPGPMGDCVRGMLRTFLTTKQVADQGCSGENYRAVGAFPQQVRDVPPHPARKLSTAQRRVLAATFATAADATARRNPNGYFYTRVQNEPGLRGGQVTFGQDITLDGVRFVRDLRVSGPIKLTPDGRATATLRAETGGRTHEVTLTWTAFSTRPSLSGTFNGIPFD